MLVEIDADEIQSQLDGGDTRVAQSEERVEHGAGARDPMLFKGGDIVDQVVGLADKNTLKQLLDKHLG